MRNLKGFWKPDKGTKRALRDGTAKFRAARAAYSKAAERDASAALHTAVRSGFTGAMLV